MAIVRALRMPFLTFCCSFASFKGQEWLVLTGNQGQLILIDVPNPGRGWSVGVECGVWVWSVDVECGSSSPVSDHILISLIRIKLDVIQQVLQIPWGGRGYELEGVVWRRGYWL